jgi:endonuclease YncB( thermonuclease family)
MLRERRAVAYRGFSKEYVDLEGMAKEVRKGIWATKFLILQLGACSNSEVSSSNIDI